MSTTLAIGRHATPAGEVTYAVTRAGDLVALGFFVQWNDLARPHERRFGGVALEAGAGTAHVAAALDAYLDGQLDALDRLRVDLGGTELQRRVWGALRTIPAGQTRSYADVARQVGAPRAVRAIGAANGANPVAIVVPCHRVIASDGRLHGYAGGLERKAWLLEHERAWPLLAVRAS